MKSKCSLLLIALFLAGALNSQAQPVVDGKVKKYHQAWDASGIETLEVVNKFGEVRINNDGGSQVTVDVVINVESESESAAQKLLSDITVEFSKSGNTAKAETRIKESFKSKSKFSIDYKVNIPPDKNLNITNKFGNTFVNELLAKGDFNIGYGNLSANKLMGSAKGDITLNLEYGKGDVSELGDATLNVAYSKLFVDEGKNLNLTSKYSGIDLGEVLEVKADSKYDGFEVDEIESLVAEMKYTTVKIGELKKKLVLTSGYGGIKVEDVSSTFELIDVNSSFGQINLKIENDAAYSLMAECQFCDINHSKSDFKGNSSKTDFTNKLDGVIGSGSPKGKVTVKSRYGNIVLGK